MCAGDWYETVKTGTMGMMTEMHEELILQFVRNKLAPFTIPELLKFLGLPANRFRREELSDYLMFNHLAYVEPSTGRGEARWLSRSALFTGRQISIAPTRAELAAGVFVIGSRFIPFYDSRHLPSELIFRYQGERIEWTSLECNPDDVYPFYVLFGEEYIPQFLAMDNADNGRRYEDHDYLDPGEITLTVLDMAAMYRDTGFTAGDRLIARVADWSAGLFDLEVYHPSAADVAEDGPDYRDHLRWCSVMENALEQTFAVIGPSSSMEDQLAFAFFLCREELPEARTCSFEDFLLWSDKISLEPYGVETRLWYSGQEIPPHGGWGMTLIQSPSNALEEALVYSGLPLNTEMLEVYVLDALYQREPDTTALLARLLPAELDQGEAIRMVVEAEVNTMYRTLSADYNFFADHETGQVRSRFTALHSALMTYIFRLERTGLEPKDLPDQGFVVLGQLMSHTVNAMEHLVSGRELEPSELGSLLASVEGMEESFFELKTGIQERLPDITRSRLKVPDPHTEEDQDE